MEKSTSWLRLQRNLPFDIVTFTFENRESSLGTLSVLPNDAIVNILSYFDLWELCSVLALVSKGMHNISISDRIWRELYRDISKCGYWFYLDSSTKSSIGWKLATLQKFAVEREVGTPNVYDHLLKCVVIGPCNTGKTEISKRLTMRGTSQFSTMHDATIVVDLFDNKIVDFSRKLILKMQVYDTPGIPAHMGLRFNMKPYLSRATVIVLVYDITSSVSFQRLVTQHLPIVLQHPDSSDAMRILVGNKVDLEKKRAVQRKEGEKLAASIGALFYEVSAKSQCNELVDVMVEKCIPVITKRNLFSII